MEEREEGIKTLIGGDFNARTGEEGGWKEESNQEENVKSRKSKDKKLNKEGRELVNFIQGRGWMIFNGNIKGDEEGEFTYTGGKGETVIDYVIRERELKEEIKKMEIGDKVESDHHPIIVWIKGKVEREERRETRGERPKGIGTWNEEEGRKFRERVGGLESGRGSVEEEIDKASIRIKQALKEVNESTKWKGRKGRGWWDEESRRKKREVRKELRKWRKGKGEGESYRSRKKEYKEICERKKKEERERDIVTGGRSEDGGKSMGTGKKRKMEEEKSE